MLGIGVGMLNLAKRVGAELVANGSFADASAWTLQAGTTTISGGTLNCTAATTTGNVFAQNTGQVQAGKTYQVMYTVVTLSSGGVSACFFDGVITLQSLTSRAAPGTYTEIITATLTGFICLQRRGADFTGSIDNVSVTEL